MLTLELSKRFKKSLKKYKHNKQVLQELKLVIDYLVNQTSLPQKYSDHELTGNKKGIRECHIKPDTLLLYYVIDEQGVLRLYDLGSHAQMFG
jgi:mRNA interferase YafQ